MSAGTVSSGGGEQSPAGGRGRRAWLAVAGAVAVVAFLLPPLTVLARRYVLVESLQFLTFGIAGPALIVLGAPWRALRLSRRDPAAPPNLAGAPAGPADRLAAGRDHHRSFMRASVFLLVFMAVSLAWRLPPVVDAMVTQPALAVLEMVTLLAAGIGLWLELAPSPPLRPRLPRPQRATVAALAMWCTWTVAYAIGMSNGAVFRAYGTLPHRALSLVADQEISSYLVWIVTGLAFIPVVYISMLSWLKGGADLADELQRLVRDENQRAVVRGWGRPAQGGSGRGA